MKDNIKNDYKLPFHFCIGKPSGLDNRNILQKPEIKKNHQSGIFKRPIFTHLRHICGYTFFRFKLGNLNLRKNFDFDDFPNAGRTLNRNILFLFLQNSTLGLFKGIFKFQRIYLSFAFILLGFFKPFILQIYFPGNKHFNPKRIFKCFHFNHRHNFRNNDP